ncbi:dihydroxyacetone kinase family protein [Microbacterium tumbae]
MTPLVNEPEEFAAEALRGFAASHPDIVTLLDGGLVRASGTPRGQVAVVLGGGSGHFPAFAGWIGAGFGSAAAAGNIFASPSESQVLRAARAAENGGGVIFVPINYAGDILHFSAAAERLAAEGIPTRLVAVTDDIASGPIDAEQGRRGIAGSLFVVKVVGAAAERGDGLDEVARIATAANDATRTLGVAFSGCTLPGAPHPLFEIPDGRMAVGLGIHGEPGLYDVPAGTADDVADLLVDGLFQERGPESGRRVAVVVNGLGGTKYDELFLVFGRVRERLGEAGMTIVAPVVGEQVTSLDMAGVSLSIAYLDEELEELWRAPAYSASFARGAVESAPVDAGHASPVLEDEPVVVVPASSAASAAAAQEIVEALGRASAAIDREQQRLGDLDAVAGDGDHGIGMQRGIRAAHHAAQLAARAGAGAGTVLRLAGDAWSDVGGGTSGALWGSGLRAAGDALGDEDGPDAAGIRAAVRAFADAVVSRGRAEPGDKTMVDAILPFAAALEGGAGEKPSAAWAAASEVAVRAAQDTADLVARRGRSHTHGDRSRGTPDPGAVSFALIVTAVLGV